MVCWALGLAAPAMCALWLGSSGCAQPGLGHHLAAHDIAHTFSQRDLDAIKAMSTGSMRTAVWDRIESRAEFHDIALLMGHGIQSEVVDSQFHDQEAIIQVRTERKRQVRLYVVYQNGDWFVDDVLREVGPLHYVSMRRQAEAVLAVRDFRRGLEAAEAGSLVQASSAEFSAEVWNHVGRAGTSDAGALLQRLRSALKGEVGEVFEGRDGTLAVKVQGVGTGATAYLVKQRARLVVDDVSIFGLDKSVRVTLREILGQER